MKKTKFKYVFSFCVLLIMLFACDSDNSNSEEKFKCCTDGNFDNIDNLGSTSKILAFQIVTPNADGINDIFFVENLFLYPNNTVTIFDSKENIVFEIEDYGANNNFFPNETLKEGSYKYKIVIENEETFLLQGYLCLINEFSDKFEEIDQCRAVDPDPLFR